MKLLTYLQQKLGFARRKIINILTHGCVYCNGTICTDSLHELQDGDRIALHLPGKKPIKLQYLSANDYSKHQHVLLFNKPRGYVVSLSDPHNRTIYDLLPSQYRTGWYYIGRLDKDSRGLVVLTADPKLVDKYEHPSRKISKTYLVQIDKQLQKQDMQQMKKGLWVDARGNVVRKELFGKSNSKSGCSFLKDRGNGGKGKIEVQKENTFQNLTNLSNTPQQDIDFLSVTHVFYTYKKSQHRLKIVLHAGKKRHIRRLLKALGYSVLDLVRISIGPYTLGNIKPGKFRCVRKIEGD